MNSGKVEITDNLRSGFEFDSLARGIILADPRARAESANQSHVDIPEHPRLLFAKKGQNCFSFA